MVHSPLGVSKIIKLFFFLLWPQFVFSAVGPSVEVLGKIIRYDGKTVTLSHEDKKGKGKITVPRASIPKHFKMQTGQCVSAVLETGRFMDYMKTLQEKAKKDHSKIRKLQKNLAD